MNKRHFISLTFVLVVVALCLGIVLCHKELTRWMCLSYLKKFEELDIKKLSIGSQEFDVRGRLKCADIFIDAYYQKQPVGLTIESLEWNSFQWFTALDAQATLNLKNIKLRFTHGELSVANINVVLNFSGWSIRNFEGFIVIPQAVVFKYPVKDLNAYFTGDTRHLDVRHLKAVFLKGTVFGRALLDWSSQLSYNANIRFKDIDLNAAKENNPALLEYFEGVLDGYVVIRGIAKNIQSLDTQVEIIKNGRIDASLLRFVTPYIPRTQETVELLELIKKRLKVPVDIAEIKFHSIDNRKLEGFSQLSTKQLNLDLNLPFEIKYDGDLNALFSWVQRLRRMSHE